MSLAGLAPLVCLGLTLLHVNYLALGWQLGWKHWSLAQANGALGRGDAAAARAAAEAALGRDAGSALARVALARASLLEGDLAAAEAQLDRATAAVPDHPLAHALRGDVRRGRGDDAGAAADLAYETATQQDLQAWGWEHFVTPAPARLEVGDGLELGFVRGVHAPAEGEGSFRWTRGAARLRLGALAGADTLRLRLASGRPDGAPVEVELLIDGGLAGSYSVGAAWQSVEIPLPEPGGALEVELRSPTFTPRAFDRASPDGRALGVMLDAAEVVDGP
jgi:hypothetical protein